MNLPGPFEKQPYLNLETFRKNGAGVQTPVWFVDDGDSLFVRTIANSGKVKRIRNRQRVRIAPCKVDGALLGDWIEASAHLVDGVDVDRKVDRLLGKKYGLMKSIFSLAPKLQGRKYAVIEIKFMEE